MKIVCNTHNGSIRYEGGIIILKSKLVTSKSKDINKIKKIFKGSFPKEERMPFFLMLLLTKIQSMEFISFYDGDTLCGFVYMVSNQNVTFIIYLAVDEELRSKGYGSCIISDVQKLYPNNKIVLYIDQSDVEALDKEQRIKRKNFYIRNNFKESGYLVQSTPKVLQEVLVKNGDFIESEFLQALKECSNGMLKANLKKKL